MASEPTVPDLEAVFDAFVASEFETKDLDATMVDEPSTGTRPHSSSRPGFWTSQTCR
jgi:hypothetical protein